MKNILVIGIGLMGGSLIKALKNYNIRAIDTNKSSINDAIKNNYIEKGYYDYSNVEECFKWANIIIICTVPSIALNIIKEYKHFIDENTILSDFCGVKTNIFNDSKDKKYIGIHTMTGKEKGSYINSDENLFKNSNVIITKNDNADDNDLKQIEELVKNIGCSKITVSTAENHDNMIAFTSQLMHIISCSIVNHDNFLESFGYEGNSLGDHTRVGIIDSNMWSELFLYNSQYLSDSLSKYIKCLDDFKNALDNKDIEKLKNLMNNSNNLKTKWLENKK